MKYAKGLSLVATMALLVVGCGGGSSKSQGVDGHEVTVERGFVLNAIVQDSSNQTAIQKSKGVYVFKTKPTLPLKVVSTEATFIDVDGDGNPSQKDMKLEKTLTSCEMDKITPVSSLVQKLDNECKKVDETYKEVAQEFGVSVKDLKTLPSKQDVKSAILTNAIYKDMDDLISIDKSELASIKTTVENIKTIVGDKVKTNKDIEEALIEQGDFDSLSSDEIAKIKEAKKDYDDGQAKPKVKGFEKGKSYYFMDMDAEMANGKKDLEIEYEELNTKTMIWGEWEYDFDSKKWEDAIIHSRTWLLKDGTWGKDDKIMIKDGVIIDPVGSKITMIEDGKPIEGKKDMEIIVDTHSEHFKRTKDTISIDFPKGSMVYKVTEEENDTYAVYGNETYDFASVDELKKKTCEKADRSFKNFVFDKASCDDDSVVKGKIENGTWEFKTINKTKMIFFIEKNNSYPAIFAQEDGKVVQLWRYEADPKETYHVYNEIALDALKKAMFEYRIKWLAKP